MINLNVLRDGPLANVPDDLLEAVIDQGFRFRDRPRPKDYLDGFLNIARQMAEPILTDDAWGEAERAFTIMVRRMVVAERRVSVLEAQVASLEDQLAAALAAAAPP